MTSSTDIALWDQLVQGNEQALYAFYQARYDELLQYGLRLCRDPEESKDAINVVFARIWNNRQRLPPTQHPKAYIFACYKNQVLRQKQQVRRMIPLSGDDLLATTQSVEEALIELQEYEALRVRTAQLLSKLTERQQELIRLRFIDGMSYEEIAARLSISVRTVYNSIHESIKALRNSAG